MMNKKTIFEVMCLNYSNRQTDNSDLMITAENHEQAFSKFVEALPKLSDDLGLDSYVIYDDEKEVHFDDAVHGECCLFLKERKIMFIKEKENENI